MHGFHPMDAFRAIPRRRRLAGTCVPRGHGVPTLRRRLDSDESVGVSAL